jgi:hypothetical protein
MRRKIINVVLMFPLLYDDPGGSFVLRQNCNNYTPVQEFGRHAVYPLIRVLNDIPAGMEEHESVVKTTRSYTCEQH